MTKRSLRKEAEWAAFYEQHMDDPDVWGEPIETPPGPQRQGLGSSITVRFSAAEHAGIQRLARARNQTYSEIVREAVNAYTRPQLMISMHAPADQHAMREALLMWSTATRVILRNHCAPGIPNAVTRVLSRIY